VHFLSEECSVTVPALGYRKDSGGFESCGHISTAGNDLARKMTPDWGREIDVDNRTSGGVNMEAGDVSQPCSQP
jgi:hypothetical protein